MGKRSGKENSPTSASEQLYGITPVYQSLKAKSRQQDELWVNTQTNAPRVQEIVHLAREQGLKIVEADAHKLGNLAGTKHHQNVVLNCGPLQTWDLMQLVESIWDQPLKVLIALDQIEDPQNLGAIIRTAAFLGAGGVITLNKHAAPLSATVSKASAGALEYFPIAVVGNLSEALQRLKREGFTVFGASAQDSVDYRKAPKTAAMVLVMGNEGQGLRNLTQKRCDCLIHIPGSGSTESLNVSAASAILIQHFLSV